jgi:hypothetical protein|tara:strand:+ start:16506 stop:17165 length:660 start_codon:yes stop_codon:yes gene_type:complete
MKPEKIYILSNGRQIKASELAGILEITTRAARNRLNKYVNVEHVFTTTSQLKAEKAKVWTLSNGLQGTVHCLALMSGLKEDTIRQRLANSTLVEKVFAKQTLKAKLFTLIDGTKLTVQEYATRMKISAENAQLQLIRIAIDSQNPRKSYLLDNGIYVTIEDVMNSAGISMSAAKYRLNTSKDAKKVLRKSYKQTGKRDVPACHHMFQCNLTGSILKISL